LQGWRPFLCPAGGFLLIEQPTHIKPLVLRLLADHADFEGRCYPGIRRLAQLAGASPNTIISATKELEAATRITVDHRRSGNRYQLLDYT
jgi:Helix-turn-helix domain